jgi:hypothetical protein
MIRIRFADGSEIILDPRNTEVPDKRDTKNKFGRQARRSYLNPAKNPNKDSHRLTQQDRISLDIALHNWTPPAFDSKSAFAATIPTEPNETRYIPNTRDQTRH